MTDTYKYEVAFSFLQQDEPLATQLNSLLQERLSTFLYSERQLELVGKDGEVMLKQVFGKQARIVVILFRKEWGTTSWTRIEQNAIRDRAYDKGYDFCLLIPLDEPPTIPEWIPKNRIWYHLKRWEIDGAAAVIENRVEEAGGTAREETPVDRAARLQKRIAAAEKRKLFLSSEGNNAANEEAKRFFNELQKIIPEISNEQIPLSTSDLKKNEGILVESDYCNFRIFWYRPYANVLKDTSLNLQLMEPDKDYTLGRTYHERQNLEYQFDVSDSEELGWRETFGEKKFFSTGKLVEFTAKMILDKVTEYRLKKINGMY